MVWITISRLITFVFGVLIGMVMTVRYYEEKDDDSVDICMKCRHQTSDGCDTWCDHGEAFEALN